MTSLAEVSIADLTGDALNWAVTACETGIKLSYSEWAAEHRDKRQYT